MKAIVYTKYGSPDVLQLKEVAKPVPKDDEVLIEVHASSINSWDWDLLRGRPLLSRLGGLLKPKYNILGADIAGRVEAVGSKVKKFLPGDEVFGDLSGCGWGGFAEYACARYDALAPKPASMSFDEAAAIPQAALLALQGLRDKGKIHHRQRVLINGAGGGAGSFAVQIAKSFATEVTAVDSTRKMNLLRLIGANQVIDYTTEDFTKNGLHYDLILDLAANHSVFDYKSSLRPEGTYVMVGGSTASIFQAMLLGPLISISGSKKIGILMHKPNKDLDFMKELYEAGKVVPIIDRRYPLNEVAEALRYFGQGQAQGKVVITLKPNDKT